MKNLLSLRCRRFLCHALAVIITFWPMVSFGAWMIAHVPMSVTRMQNVATDGTATGVGQVRTVQFSIQPTPGNYFFEGFQTVQSVNSGTPMMPMYTWSASIPPSTPTGKWSLSLTMMGAPIPDHYVVVPAVGGGTDDISNAISVIP